MSWVDRQFLANKVIAFGGAALPPQPEMEFTGSVTVSDDPANGATKINVSSGTPSQSLDSSGSINIGDLLGASPVSNQARKAISGILAASIALSSAPASGTPTVAPLFPIVSPAITGLSGPGSVIRNPSTGRLQVIATGSATASDDYIGEIDSNSILTVRTKLVDVPAIGIQGRAIGLVGDGVTDNAPLWAAAKAKALAIATRLGAENPSAYAVVFDGGTYAFGDSIDLAINDNLNGYETGTQLRGAVETYGGVAHHTALLWTRIATATGTTASMTSSGVVTGITGADSTWIGQYFYTKNGPNFGAWPIVSVQSSTQITVNYDLLANDSSGAIQWAVCKPFIRAQSRHTRISNLYIRFAAGSVCYTAVQYTRPPWRGTIGTVTSGGTGSAPLITTAGVPHCNDVSAVGAATLIVTITGAATFTYSVDGGTGPSTSGTCTFPSNFTAATHTVVLGDGVIDPSPPAGVWAAEGSGIQLTFPAGSYSVGHTFTIPITSNKPNPCTDNALEHVFMDTEGAVGAVYANGVTVGDYVGVAGDAFAPYTVPNCDYVKIFSSTIFRHAHAAIHVTSNSGQSKQHLFIDLAMLGGVYGIRMRGGSFMAISPTWGNITYCVTTAQAVDDIVMMNVQGEGNAFFMLSESSQSSIYPVQIVGGRLALESAAGNLAATQNAAIIDGIGTTFLARFGASDGTFIDWQWPGFECRGVGFNGDSTDTLFKISLHNSNTALTMTGSFTGCAFPIANPFVSVGGAKQRIWVQGCHYLSGGIFVPCNDGYFEPGGLSNVPLGLGSLQVAPTQTQLVGGVDANGTKNPHLLTDRIRFRTTDGTANQTADSYTPVDGQLFRVFYEVQAEDGTDAAYFTFKAVYRRSGSSLTAVIAPTAIDSASTAGASTWAANMTTSGAAELLRVTGQASKTIQWGIAREIVIGKDI